MNQNEAVHLRTASKNLPLFFKRRKKYQPARKLIFNLIFQKEKSYLSVGK